LKERSLEGLVRSQLLRQKQNPHKFYVPNGKIASFVKLVGQNKTFVSLLSAANGVGKTATGSVIIAHILYGASGNPYFDLPLFNEFPYISKRGRIVSDPTTVQQTLIPELKKWFPPGRYTTDKQGKNYEYHWRTDTRFEFDVMTYEQDVKEFESATLSWCWFDEPPPLNIFKATVARMRRGGIIFITATPLMGSAWMYDHILNYHGNEGQRDFIEADIEDNCKQHGVRGILEHGDIEKMIAEYDEDDKQARIHGKFQHLTGLVFKNFNRKIHVIKPFKISHADFCAYEALDPHPRNPDALLWVAVDNSGNKFVIDEYYRSGTTSELAVNIHKRSGLYRIVDRIADPAAFVQDQHQIDPEAQTLAGKLLNDHGIEYRPATKDRDAANRRIKDALDYEMKGEEILYAPELYIFDTCLRTIYEIEHYQWDEWHGKISERKDPREKAMDRDDHMIENLGRILVQEPVFIRMAPKNYASHTGVKSPKDFDPYES
jgi:phage terminase large subunit-like protein